VPGGEVRQHLDLHFRLVRHDAVASLGEAVRQFRADGGLPSLDTKVRHAPMAIPCSHLAGGSGSSIKSRVADGPHSRLHRALRTRRFGSAVGCSSVLMPSALRAGLHGRSLQHAYHA
jgi:hypothetical protein